MMGSSSWVFLNFVLLASNSFVKFKILSTKYSTVSATIRNDYAWAWKLFGFLHFKGYDFLKI